VSEEWGPWVEHDGKGCPCVGMWVHRVFLDNSERNGILVPQSWMMSWHWKSLDRDGWSMTPRQTRAIPVTRYRIRKPRALLDMIERAAELDRVKETT
jgi:hypothetical protein